MITLRNFLLFCFVFVLSSAFAQVTANAKNSLLFYRLEKNGSYTLISDTAGKYANETDLKSSKEENVEIYYRYKGSDYTKAIYTGEMTKIKLEVGKVQLPHGSGNLISDQLNYDGQWLVGEMNGKGKWKLGAETYNGDFKKSIFNGSGLYAGSNGVYDGNWINGKRHGNGTIWFVGKELPICEYGSLKAKKLETTWENDSIKGEGVLTYEEVRPRLKLREGEEKLRNNASGMDAPQEKTIPEMDSEKKIYWNGLKMTGEINVVFTNGNTFRGSIENGRVEGKGNLGIYDGVGEYKDFMQGKWKSGKFTGRCLTTYSKKSYYRGEMLNSVKHGSGEMADEDGSIYSGEWVDGERTGKGAYTFSDGSKYTGEFVKGNFNGMGVYKNSKGDVWTCKWKEDLPVDSGEIAYASGALYKGGLGGKRSGTNIRFFYQGYGRFIQRFPTEDTSFRNDSSYTGYYNEGLPNGKGIMSTVNSSDMYSNEYDGEWLNGVKHGKGKWTFGHYQRTEQYNGEWKNNKKDGAGELMIAGGSTTTTCKGTWSNDVLTGYAECTEVFYDRFSSENNEITTIFKGQYNNDVLQGEGTEISEKGTYTGNFVDGVKSGFGKMVYKNGQIYEGNWANEQPNGEGKMRYANGTTKQGKFIDGEFGMLTDIDGNVYSLLKVGSMLWMADNLKVTRYQNGDQISTTYPATKDIGGQNSAVSKYQWSYTGKEAGNDKFGRHYTWYAVTDVRNICPAGWRVPTIHEWWALDKELNSLGQGITPFKPALAGCRSAYGNYVEDGRQARWWSTTDYTDYGNVWNIHTKVDSAPDVNYSENSSDLLWETYKSYSSWTVWGETKNTGLSVRCIKK